jgi:hypothetical protein
MLRPILLCTYTPRLGDSRDPFFFKITITIIIVVVVVVIIMTIRTTI